MKIKMANNEGIYAPTLLQKQQKAKLLLKQVSITSKCDSQEHFHSQPAEGFAYCHLIFSVTRIESWREA